MDGRTDGAVLVAGGAGYVGSHVVFALLDAGRRVVVLDDLSTGQRANVDPRAVFFEGSVFNDSLVRTIIALHRIDAIIHLAGSTHASVAAADPLRHYRANVASTTTLVGSALAGGVPHFVYAGTTECYRPGAGPQAETAPVQPVSPYAVSHVSAECILAHVAAAHPLNYAVLRLGRVAGADRLQRCGDLVVSQTGEAHVLHRAVEAVLGTRDGVELDAGDADRPRPAHDYVHVSDLAQAYVALLPRLAAAPRRSLVLNCGYGRGWTDAEVVAAVERVTKARVPVRPVPAAPTESAIGDPAAIRAELGWAPDCGDLDTIVRDTYFWQLRQRRSAPGRIQPERPRPKAPAKPAPYRPASGASVPPLAWQSAPTAPLPIEGRGAGQPG